jgi:hypothetical protein
MGHLMKALQIELMPLAYAAALRFWVYPILIILAVGVWRGRRQPSPPTIAVHPA